MAKLLKTIALYVKYSTLSQLGCNILWKIFREGMIVDNGRYLNLATMKVNPIGV